jgi:hypothetical protein
MSMMENRKRKEACRKEVSGQCHEPAFVKESNVEYKCGYRVQYIPATPEHEAIRRHQLCQEEEHDTMHTMTGKEKVTKKNGPQALQTHSFLPKPTSHLLLNILHSLLLDNRQRIRSEHAHSLTLPLWLPRLTHLAPAPPAVIVLVAPTPPVAVPVVVTRIAA